MMDVESDDDKKNKDISNKYQVFEESLIEGSTE